MQQLWLIPSLPLVGFLLLVLGHGRCNRSVARLIGVGSVAMAALVTFWVALDFYSPGAPQS
jgi:NADH-quinone oxidoreductase subunit L